MIAAINYSVRKVRVVSSTWDRKSERFVTPLLLINVKFIVQGYDWDQLTATRSAAEPYIILLTSYGGNFRRLRQKMTGYWGREDFAEFRGYCAVYMTADIATDIWQVKLIRQGGFPSLSNFVLLRQKIVEKMNYIYTYS